MKRPPAPLPEKDLATLVREAFVADDPEAAWYLDRTADRVVRVSHGATDDPELTAEEVEEDDDRYVEIPALTGSEQHAWMEEFVEERADPRVTALLDERQGANERFVTRLAETDAAASAAWKAFHAAHLDAAIAAWRAEIE